MGSFDDRGWVKDFAKSLTLEDDLLVALMKIKLGLFNRDTSIRFRIITGDSKNISLLLATTC